MAHPYSIFNTRNITDPGAGTTQGVSVTGAATTYSDMWTGEDADGHGLTVFTTGTLTGTFTLWGTDKPNPNPATDDDWVQDTGFVPTNPAGAAVKFRDDAGNSKAHRKRVKFVSTAGTGVVTGFVSIPRNGR